MTFFHGRSGRQQKQVYVVVFLAMCGFLLYVGVTNPVALFGPVEPPADRPSGIDGLEQEQLRLYEAALDRRIRSLRERTGLLWAVKDETLARRALRECRSDSAEELLTAEMARYSKGLRQRPGNRAAHEEAVSAYDEALSRVRSRYPGVVREMLLEGPRSQRPLCSWRV